MIGWSGCDPSPTMLSRSPFLRLSLWATLRCACKLAKPRIRPSARTPHGPSDCGRPDRDDGLYDAVQARRKRTIAREDSFYAEAAPYSQLSAAARSEAHKRIGHVYRSIEAIPHLL